MKRPQAARTVQALFGSLADASGAVSEVIRQGLFPAALEIMDRLAIQAVESGNFPAGYPQGQEAVLLIEVDGLAAGLAEQAERIVAICQAHNVQAVRVAATAAERALWWNNRKTAFGAAGKLSPDYVVQDGVIPRSRLAEVLAQVQAIGARHGVQIANVFHAGDGNLHPLILYDRTRPGEMERAVQAGSDILAACVAAGGSITGEHGIGVEKRQELTLMYSPTDLAWQRRVRAAFDPAGRSNPGKIFID